MRETVLVIAFAFFVMCPRMAGVYAVISKVGGVNLYAIALIGGLMAVPLIALTECR